MKKNYYDILEVNKNASPEIIEKAYKVLVKKYHPDLQEPDKKAFFEQKLKNINEAYDTLSNTEKRKQYNMQLEELEKKQIENLYNENINLKNELNNIKDNSNSAYNNHDNNLNNNLYNNDKNQRTNHNTYQNININNNSESNNKYYNQNRYYKTPNYKYDYNYKKLYYKNILKIKLRHLITDIVAILIIILLFYILWQIPFIRNYLTDLYNENIVIQTVVNFFKDASN